MTIDEIDSGLARVASELVAAYRDRGAAVPPGLEFCTVPVRDVMVESAAEAFARGLSPPTTTERDERRRHAMSLLLRVGTPEYKTYVRDLIQQEKDVKSGQPNRTAGAIMGRAGDDGGRGGPGIDVARPRGGSGRSPQRGGTFSDGSPVP
jgi:hypothetical protein